MVILIADDDRLVRFSIKSMLGEILGDCGDVFAEAANGRDMVELCRSRKPDVAFVDIKMPYMNGLDAISESRKYSENTEYVLVSGYSDFEYAQRGIGLGVNEYLLKPVDEEKLYEVIQKIKDKVQVKKEESNSRFQLKVMERFNNQSVNVSEQTMADQQETDYTYLGFVIYVKTSTQDRSISMQIQQELISRINALGKKIIKSKGYYAIPYTKEGFPCALFCIKREQRNEILSSIKKIFLEENRKNNNNFQYIAWFEKKTLEEAYNICNKLDQEAYIGMNYRSGSMYHCSEVELGKADKEFLQLVEQLMNAWEIADGMTCNAAMNQIWRTYRDQKLNINLQNISRYCEFVTGGNVADDTLKSFCRSLVEQSDQMYGKVVREESDMIEQVKKYIQEYYMNDISISQIADDYQLTANYLSTVFHGRTGSKFIDYLTQVRMEAAKKLLIKNASASVQDIALMVGYNSARHFSTLFQKATGETPTAYRKLRL